MKFQSLTGNWQFRQVGTGEWFPATVPGSVHTDLFNLGRIPDPFIGDKELDVLWVAEKDWEYMVKFKPHKGIYHGESLCLVADGLDTIAEIFLNQYSLGSVNNQFRQWRWNIKDFLVEGENTLLIRFSGPSTYASHQQNERRMKGVSQALEGGPHIRKAPCQFGWDWGPMLPSIGIWKDIRLEERSTARIADIHIRQIHAEHTVSLQIRLAVEKWKPIPLHVSIEITDPNGVMDQTHGEIISILGEFNLNIESPLLWWPNGHGSQHLYQLKVFLKNGQETLDQKDYKLGLRKIELIQEKDEYGKSFQFYVNNIPIFMKGSNWIPADSFITRISDEHLEKLIEHAAASNQNMLRVWGGGIYEEERFYNHCDKYGILVWQDFIFSCSIYPLDEIDFFQNVRAEIEENIKRLRHRASLALWCGNNEMEWGWESWGWQKHPLEDQLPDLIRKFPELQFITEMARGRDVLPDWKILKSAYDQFFHHTLPGWIEALDPDTPYWPSSPSSNTPFKDANSQRQGDAHYWEVWHGRKPFTAYRSSYPRFMSEFGFQAFPTMETIEFFTKPEDLNLTSYIMEHHQRGNHGNGLIIAQMTDTFRMPKDFPAWIYLSLILQSEGIRYGVEHWRRNMHRVGGTLYWQLNDCWPVASWASIDYFGRWKALHYAAKRFYAPILLSVEDNPPQMDIHVTNDTTNTFEGKILWSLESTSGEVLDSNAFDLSAKPLSNTIVNSMDFSDKLSKDNKRKLVFICELWQRNTKLSTCVSPFVPNKHVAFYDPEITTNIELGNETIWINLTSKSLARFVELKLLGTDTIFSDNYFDIPAGRSVQLSCKRPDGWSTKAVKSALRIYSLYDSY